MPELGNIQSLVAVPATLPRTFVLLFTLGNPAAARGFLRWCLPRIPSAATPPAAIARPLHLGMTWPGLAKLSSPPLDPAEGAAEFEPSFVRDWPDHPSVAPAAGFHGRNAPAHWWQGRFSNAQIELVVHAGFEAGEEEAGLAELRAAADAAGLVELTLPAFPDGAMNGCRPAGGVLHFGYRDGITKPNIDWAGNGAGRVDFREIVLGYPNHDYPQSPFAPGPWQDLARDGSFACLAWIHQDVAAFNRLLAEVAPGLPLPEGVDRSEWLAARMMGRWRDGSPVMRWPMTPPAEADLDDEFLFAGDDPRGERCPLTAHIRIVNARDDRLTFANRSRFPKGPPRFMRRGFTYGPRLEGTVDDGRERGIVGIFFCARINEQFYTVLRWMQATTFAEGFATGGHSKRMQDALFGLANMPDADRRLLLGPDASGAIVGLRDLITFRGVLCCLMPSMTTVRRLSAA
jgi:deferrochelatase/peroxidase EfeB